MKQKFTIEDTVISVTAKCIKDENGKILVITQEPIEDMGTFVVIGKNTIYLPIKEGGKLFENVIYHSWYRFLLFLSEKSLFQFEYSSRTLRLLSANIPDDFNLYNFRGLVYNNQEKILFRMDSSGKLEEIKYLESYTPENLPYTLFKLNSNSYRVFYCTGREIEEDIFLLSKPQNPEVVYLLKYDDITEVYRCVKKFAVNPNDRIYANAIVEEVVPNKKHRLYSLQSGKKVLIREGRANCYPERIFVYDKLHKFCSTDQFFDASGGYVNFGEK